MSKDFKNSDGAEPTACLESVVRPIEDGDPSASEALAELGKQAAISGYWLPLVKIQKALLWPVVACT